MQATDVPLDMTINLTVNGAQQAITVDVRTSLLDMLRERLHLSGTKKGCDHGQCGACTVQINGRRVNSCLCFAAMYQDDDITTIEGLGQPENLHAMQAAVVAHDGYQCGYCTSGQIMSAVALLKEPCGPEDADVKEFMSGNICRCGAYPNIVAAIQRVRQNAKPEKAGCRVSHSRGPAIALKRLPQRRRRPQPNREQRFASSPAGQPSSI